MAFVLDDRCRETSTAPGTGSFTMNGAVQGAQTFASALTSNADTTWYAATNGTAWETGLLTRTSATVFARTTIFRSTNANAAVNFSTGTVDVFCDVPGSKAKSLERLTWAAGGLTLTGTLALTGALTYGGVALSNAVTGTGNMVLSAGPTFTGTITAAIANFSGATSFNSTNNDGITINGGAAASSALLFSTSDATAGNRNWAIRNRFNTFGTLEFSSSSTVGGAINTLVAGFDNAGQFKIFTSTASSSTATGALVVSGGVGINGSLYVGSGITQTGSTLARFENTGASSPSGATGIGLEIFITAGSSFLQSFNRTGSAYAPMTFAASSYTFSSSGDVFIGTSTLDIITAGTAGLTVTAGGILRGVVSGNPSLNLGRLSSDGSIATFFRQTTQVGSISVTAAATAFNTSSDETIKMMFDEDDIDWGDRIDRLWVGAFQMKADPGQWRFGIRAQQAHGIVPQGVTRPKSPSELYMVDYSLALAPLAMWGVKDARKRISDLTTKVAMLEERLAA
jgi:hypothetical protein